MSLQNQILDLLLKLKDKSISSNEKEEIKKQLKKLYTQMRKVSKTPKIKSGFMEEVENVLKPIKQSIVSDSQKIKSFEKTIKKQISELEAKLQDPASPEEQKAMSDAIESKQEDLKLFNEAVKAGEAPEVIKRQLIAKEKVTAENFPEFVKQVYREKMQGKYMGESDLNTAVAMLLAYPMKRLYPDVWNSKTEKQKMYKQLISEAKNAIKDEEARRLEQGAEVAELERERLSAIGQARAEENLKEEAIKKQRKAKAVPVIQAAADLESKEELPIGQGKRRKKMHGGAGIGDWLLTLGSIPGVPQLMNNMGPFGQVLGNASGLAQSFGKTAGQLMKEGSKEGEKVAGFTDALGGLKSLVGFGKKRGGKKMNMADMSGGAFLSDFLGTLGGITPKLGGVIGAIPTYGKVATIGNSVLGSASRVGEDIAKMLGLGNMDTTLSGFGNSDLSNNKGYGRRGGRKMLPLGRPMPRGQANILPYGLSGGAYGLTDMLLNTTGDLIKAGVKGLANSGVQVAKDLAKTGIRELANKGVNALGNGRRKKCKKPCMRGCGKIQGQWVSPEYEAEYERALLNNNLVRELQNNAAAKQLEAQIQRQLNVEQGDALTQLQYYDLLSKAQQRLLQEQQ